MFDGPRGLFYTVQRLTAEMILSIASAAPRPRLEMRHQVT